MKLIVCCVLLIPLISFSYQHIGNGGVIEGCDSEYDAFGVKTSDSDDFVSMIFDEDCPEPHSDP